MIKVIKKKIVKGLSRMHLKKAKLPRMILYGVFIQLKWYITVLSVRNTRRRKNMVQVSQILRYWLTK